jgi:hypothetical protein
VAAATIGKTVLALPAAALAVAYPRLVAGFVRPARQRVLVSALLVVGVPALAGALVVALAPDLVLTVLYGRDTFADAAGLVRVLALVAGLSAFVSVFAYAALARKGRLAFAPWVGAALEIVMIELWHGSATQVALGSAAALAVTLTCLAISEPLKWRGAPNLTAGAVPEQ